MFQIRQYDERLCSKCEYRPERHCNICEECPVGAYLGELKLWRSKEKDGERFIGMPVGRPSLIKEVVGKDTRLKIKDKRSATPMKYGLKFTGKLYDNQLKPVADMIRKERGILEAPPRSGKTVMAIAIACKLGLKTLILAKQYDWLKQFEETILGTKKGDKWKDRPMTNAPEIQERLNKKVVGFCKDPKEMHKLDIVLATYQSFITTKGRKRLKKIMGMFGLVVIDECHNIGSDHYLRVVGEMNARYVIGLTGTPERKDGKHELSAIVLGKVKTRAKVETMVPRVEIVETPASTAYQYQQWFSAINYLSNHKGRNKLIVKMAVQDIKAGRSIVIPVERVKHVQVLTDMINKKMGLEVPVCIGFGGKDKGAVRDLIREGAKSGKIKCVVGMRKMVQVGINVPRWDTLYEVMPIANHPNLTQETSRIRTVVPGKKEPLIRHFLEKFGPTQGCFRTSWWQTYMPLGFIVSEETKKLAKQYMSSGKKAQPQESIIF